MKPGLNRQCGGYVIFSRCLLCIPTWSHRYRSVNIHVCVAYINFTYIYIYIYINEVYGKLWTWILIMNNYLEDSTKIWKCFLPARLRIRNFTRSIESIQVCLCVISSCWLSFLLVTCSELSANEPSLWQCSKNIVTPYWNACWIDRWVGSHIHNHWAMLGYLSVKT